MFTGNAAGTECGGAQKELPGLAVAQDVNGADAGATRQRRGYLRHAVTVWVKQDNLSTGAVGQKSLELADTATDKYDLGS